MHVLLLVGLFACSALGLSPSETDDLAGGWHDIGAASAATLSVRDQLQAVLRERTGDETLTITAVISARQQVVAGFNYALVVDVETGTGHARGVKIEAHTPPGGGWVLNSVEGLELPPAAPELSDDDVDGGWSEADPESPALKTARDEVQTLLRKKTGDKGLVIRSVTSARQQVVAGMNYELVLDLSSAAGDRSGVRAVAYRDLKRQWTLTSVEGL